MKTVSLRPASTEDLPAIRSLLEGFGLPSGDLSGRLEEFIVAEDAGVILGSIGLETYGDTGLLRSAAVKREFQGSGLGIRLHDALVARARILGLRRLVLLTTTAERFFAARGFRRVNRDSVTGPVRTSTEFATLCPASAVCMEKML